MNPLLKKAVAAVAVKEAIEKVQEMRRPKPSRWSRMAPFAIIAALGGAVFYLTKNGKLPPVVGGKNRAGGGTSNGSSSWTGGSTAPTPSTATPSPTV